MMALTRGMNGMCPCPVCLVPQEEQITLTVNPTWPLRDPKVAEELVALKGTITAAALNEKLQPLGLRPVEVWSNICLHAETLIYPGLFCRTFSGESQDATSIGHCHGTDCMHIMVVSSVTTFLHSFS